MQKRKKLIIILLLLILAILIHFYSSDSIRAENNYSTKWYPTIAASLRFLTGWIPFSIGDVLYAIAALWLVWKIISIIIGLFKRQLTFLWLKKAAYKMVVCLLCIYIVFNIFWGINYHREGIAYQLGLNDSPYTISDLKTIDSLLLLKVNESKEAVIKNHLFITNNKELFTESVEAYNVVANQYSFLKYKMPSIKRSMWGWLGNYLGYSGYYDPFTGEAQVNTTIPKFLQPYTTCHEMAHQLGYAKEDEANFVGYLAASASTDTLFHYSVYLDLFLSCNRNLYMADSAAAISDVKKVLPVVKTDLKEWRKFLIEHNSVVEPIVRWLYGKYLQSNQQPSGILTYDKVTGLLIEYYKKTGKI